MVCRKAIVKQAWPAWASWMYSREGYGTTIQPTTSALPVHWERRATFLLRLFLFVYIVSFSPSPTHPSYPDTVYSLSCSSCRFPRIQTPFDYHQRIEAAPGNSSYSKSKTNMPWNIYVTDFFNRYTLRCFGFFLAGNHNSFVQYIYAW